MDVNNDINNNNDTNLALANAENIVDPYSYIPKKEIIKTSVHDLNSLGKIIFDNDNAYIKLTHLIFKTNNEITIAQFKNEIKDGTINMILGGTPEYLDLGLCCELNQPIKLSNNVITLKLPFDIMFENIITGRLDMHYFEFCVELTNQSYFEKISVVVEHTQVDNDILIGMRNGNGIEKCIQQFQTCKVETNGMVMDISLNFNHPTKGYFIQCDNINNISSIALLTNNRERFNYDKIMLDLFSFKISDSLMFISLTNKNNYKECTFESYIGSLNQSRVERILMKIMFNTQLISPVKIHSINMNVHRYFAGIIGMAWSN